MNIQLLLLLAALVVGALVGIQWHRKDLFPFPQLRAMKHADDAPPAYRDKVVTLYTKGLPLFSDRAKYDRLGDPRLEGLYLVQIPRHLRTEVRIRLLAEATVYRIVCERNDPAPFADWARTDIPLDIVDHNCSRYFVVERDFPPGDLVLAPGGPVSAAAILVKPKAGTAPTFDVVVDP